MPIAIIGGGVLGLSVAYALLEQGWPDVLVLEKNQGFGLEQSDRNSGVIHAGLLYETGTLMASLCVEGQALMYDFCRRHRVPHRRTGKLMVATRPWQQPQLERYQRLAINNGLENVTVISGTDAAKMEPCLDVVCALHVPQSGVLDCAAFIAALYRNAAALHPTPDLLMRGCRVTGIEPLDDGFRLRVSQTRGARRKWTVDCEHMINAAGLYALDVARLLDPRLPVDKQYLKGEYYQFNQREALHVSMNVYPLPTPVVLPDGGHFMDLGAHLTPKAGVDAHGHTALAREVLVGPIFEEVSDPDDYRAQMDAAHFFQSVRPFFPSLRQSDLYRGHTGIIGLIKDQTDFHIQRDRLYPNCVHLLGMESPALTASLAIGRHVAQLMSA